MRACASFLIAALVAAWPGAVPAQNAAPCQLCAAVPGDAGESPSEPVRLDVATNLDFDRLVVTGPDGGVAQIRPDGIADATGSLEMSGRAMVGTAVIRGEPNRLVRVDLPGRIELQGLGGGQIVIEGLATDLPTLPRLDGDGRLSFRFGGALKVVGDAEGNYRGDVAITVDYL
jgi:hypothetical protein